MKTLALVLGIIVVIGVTAFVSTNYNSLVGNNLGGTDTAQDLFGNEKPTPQNTNVLYDDDITLNVNLANSLNGTTYTDGTEADIKYYGLSKDGGYEWLVDSSSGTASIPTRLLSDSIVYAEVVIPSDKKFFTDLKGIKSANGGIISTIFYDDLDQTGPKHYVVGIDISHKLTNPNPESTPKETWILKLFGEGALTLNTADSVTGISTGDANAVIEWKPSFTNNAEANVISKIKIRVNDTTTAKWSKNDSNLILTVGKVGNTKEYNLGTDFIESTDFSNSLKIYEKTFSNTIDGGDLVYVPNSGTKKIEATLDVGTTFTASTDALCFELEITTVNAQGTQSTTSLSDDVEVTGASSVGDECTIS